LHGENAAHAAVGRETAKYLISTVTLNASFDTQGVITDDTQIQASKASENVPSFFVNIYIKASLFAQ
jgi:hypothetical protein